MRKLYRASCAGCTFVVRALTVERLGKKIAAHCCWKAVWRG